MTHRGYIVSHYRASCWHEATCPTPVAIQGRLEACYVCFDWKNSMFEALWWTLHVKSLHFPFLSPTSPSHPTLLNVLSNLELLIFSERELVLRVSYREEMAS